MIGYHNSINTDLKEIHNEGQYAGIFVSLNAALMRVADYSQIIIKPIQWCNELFRTF